LGYTIRVINILIDEVNNFGVKPEFLKWGIFLTDPNLTLFSN